MVDKVLKGKVRCWVFWDWFCWRIDEVGLFLLEGLVGMGRGVGCLGGFRGF